MKFLLQDRIFFSDKILQVVEYKKQEGVGNAVFYQKKL
jgi:hypothetical protein